MKNYVLSPSHYLSAAGLRLDSILKVACRVPVAYLKEYNQQFFTVVLNKYLKHVFNIVLKLSNHIWKKLQNYFFCGKKWGPNQWFCSREKSSKSLKKDSSSWFVRIWSSKRCAEFFKKQMVLEIFKFRWF